MVVVPKNWIMPMFAPDRLKTNAFRVLRLPSKATLVDVHRAAADMRRAALLGTITTRADDMPELGEIPKSEADIRAAVGRIENPELRIIDRLFWFHSDKASIVETKSFIRHDLALREMVDAFSESVDEACIQEWAKALRVWQQVVSDDNYWAQIVELEFEGGFEPAAFPSEIEELRTKAVELAAEPLVIAGREAIDRNNTEAVRHILTVLETLKDTGIWAESAQLDIASVPVKHFRTLCESIREEFSPKVLREPDVGKKNQIVCAAELVRFRTNVQPELARLTQILPPSLEGLQEIREAAALLLSSIATDFTWADEFIESEKLYEEALKLAENTFGAIRIQTSLEEVRSSAQHQRATGKPISSAPPLFSLWGWGFTIYGHYNDDPATRSYTTNYYFTGFFLPIFPISRYRVIDAGNRKYQFLGKLPLRRGDWWHLGIGLSVLVIVLVIATASNSDSHASYSAATTPVSSYPSSGPSTSSSDVSTQSSSNDADLSELRQKIEAGRSQMTGIDNRLKPAMDEVTSIDEQMKSLKSEIDTLKQEEAEGTEIDTGHYNSLVNDYNSLLRRKQSLLNENMPAINRYEALKKEDESLMRQWQALGGKVE